MAMRIYNDEWLIGGNGQQLRSQTVSRLTTKACMTIDNDVLKNDMTYNHSLEPAI